MSDFDYLVNSTDLHLNLSSYICIVRYGEIFRGDKVKIWGKSVIGRKILADVSSKQDGNHLHTIYVLSQRHRKWCSRFFHMFTRLWKTMSCAIH